jgi:hypothetical protein
MEEVPIESFEMPDIEDNAVAFCDRTLVARVRIHDGKEIIGSLTSVC